MKTTKVQVRLHPSQLQAVTESRFMHIARGGKIFDLLLSGDFKRLKAGGDTDQWAMWTFDMPVESFERLKEAAKAHRSTVSSFVRKRLFVEPVIREPMESVILNVSGSQREALMEAGYKARKARTQLVEDIVSGRRIRFEGLGVYETKTYTLSIQVPVSTYEKLRVQADALNFAPNVFIRDSIFGSRQPRSVALVITMSRAHRNAITRTNYLGHGSTEAMLTAAAQGKLKPIKVKSEPYKDVVAWHPLLTDEVAELVRSASKRRNMSLSAFVRKALFGTP